MKTVSIVICTYNGQSYLREQLDSVINQTYPLREIIIQDDGSNDGTWSILQEYAEKDSRIKLFVNEGERGFDPNFYSAMFKATSDYIALCDQDDIWELTKIERQMQSIGDSWLSTCKSKPFSMDGSAVTYNDSRPNYNLIRLLFCSCPGHTLLFKRELLNLLPRNEKETDYYGTDYDVILATTAASYADIDVVDEVLVHFRRHPNSATSVKQDEMSSISNKSILWYGLTHYAKIKPSMQRRFRVRVQMLEDINAQTPIWKDALKILKLETRKDLISLFRLQGMFIKHRHHLFHTEEKGFLNLLKAILYPFVQVYLYRHLPKLYEAKDKAKAGD